VQVARRYALRGLLGTLACKGPAWLRQIPGVEPGGFGAELLTRSFPKE